MILIQLNYQDRTPIYEQIVATIERYVALGILKPKEQMPSIRELATSLGINPNTVKKAYDILDQKNVITTFSTKGTYITDQTERVLEKRRKEELEIFQKQIDLLKSLQVSEQEMIEVITKNKKE